MSKEKKEAKPEQEDFALSSTTAEHLKQLEQALFERSDTDEKLMESRRRQIALISMHLDKTVFLLDALEQKSPTAAQTPEYQALVNKFMMLNAQLSAKGIEFLCDALSWRLEAEVELPNGKVVTGFMRKTAADSLEEMSNVTCDENEGMAARIENMCAMLNDIGNHFKCFLNKHGVHDPKKHLIVEYAQPEKRKVKENEAVVEEN